MTMTHVSHFGLTLLSETSTGLVFEGSLGACKRMAFAHGLEVDEVRGPILGSVNGVATYGHLNPERPMSMTFKGGGLVQRAQDGYCLVLPRSVWENQ